MSGLQALCRRWKAVPGFLLLLALLATDRAKAQQAETESKKLVPITIKRQPGHEAGEAQIIEKDQSGKAKTQRVAPHAVSAWRVRGIYGALVVVVQPAKGQVPKQYVLRYYDLESGRRRILGSIPMSGGSLS